MAVKQLGLGYSLKQILEEETRVPTVLQFDGMKLPEEKPFIKVKQMPNTHEAISKRRETIVTSYSYEIGVFETSLAERSSTQDTIRELFLFEDIPLYNEAGERTGDSFKVTIENEVPLDAEDISDTTKSHRMYFDVVVQGVRHKNRGNK